MPERGSHLGFLSGRNPGTLRSWAEQGVIAWLEERIG
jgi:predicted alpha/beta-fold hydrolase